MMHFIFYYFSNLALSQFLKMVTMLVSLLGTSWYHSSDTANYIRGKYNMIILYIGYSVYALVQYENTVMY